MRARQQPTQVFVQTPGGPRHRVINCLKPCMTGVTSVSPGNTRRLVTTRRPPREAPVTIAAAIVALLCALFPADAYAGANTWTTFGPESAYVNSLAIDPSAPAILYAGTYDGVFKSGDRGRTWTPVNIGLASTYVSALAINPSAPATLYAGTDSGVFKSGNGGLSWTVVDNGLTNTAVSTLAIDPSAPATLYAGTNGGIFKSTNGGLGWTTVNFGLSNTTVFVLSVDPSAPARLYAGTLGGVFKSSNGGQNWTAMDVGLTNTTVFALSIDPSAPSTLYAGTNDGVFKSVNGGLNWTAANNGLTDVGVNALPINPSAPSTLYAGTNDGVFKSTNGGQTWTDWNSGLTNTEVTALAIDPSSPSNLYAGTFGDGVFDYEGASCTPDATTLCLNNSRFRVTTRWTTPQSQIETGEAFAPDGNGVGQAVGLTSDTGYFWFFSSNNIEMVVKVVDGRPFNSRFWVFAGGLTNVNVVMTVTDTQTGTVKFYTNPQGTAFQPIQDTDAFGASTTPVQSEISPAVVSAALEPPDLSIPISSSTSIEPSAAQAPCVADLTTLCLNAGRFRVQTQWTTAQGQIGAGQAVLLTPDTGYFWFFSSNNVEMVVKGLNACTFNSHFWVFAGGLTNVRVVMTVTDTQTGAVQTYTNPQGTAFQPIQDTSAFATCP